MRAGFATTSITPGPGVPMAGYGTRLQGALGTHDELEARAVWLEQGATAVALVSTDLVAVDTTLTDEVGQRLADVLEPDKGLILTATHSHAGPVVVRTRVGSRNDQPGAERVAPMIAERVAAAVREARARARPARVGAGRTTIEGLGSNRRRLDGPFNPTATVASIQTADGQPIVALMHYACHPTVLDASNRLYSAEYPGAARRLVEARTGMPVVFLQGAAGDVSTRFTRREPSFTEVERFGRLLAEPVANLIMTLHPNREGPLACVSRTVRLPTRRLPSAAEAERAVAAADERLEGLRAGGAAPGAVRVAETALFGARRTLRLVHEGLAPEIEARLAAVRLDGLRLVTVPGELFTANAAEITRQAGDGDLVVVGYANGYVGYLPAPGEEDGYEVGASVVSAEGVQALVRAAVEVAGAVGADNEQEER
jgi:hypothetical protein